MADMVLALDSPDVTLESVGGKAPARGQVRMEPLATFSHDLHQKDAGSSLGSASSSLPSASVNASAILPQDGCPASALGQPFWSMDCL